MKQAEKDAIERMYLHHDYMCFVCHHKVTQRAHIISNSKVNRKRYGSEIIDSPLNWLGACNLKHNALIDIGKNDLLIDLIVFYIQHNNREDIEDIVRGNIERKRNKT